ncbi:hypothetical protein [Pantoea stewartii]|uniref:hypothetical protein n=1 Tax=Pantoea stewartii TaxID=66269 RepID=UPI0025A0AE60|nr:hypothetical protein [Pantoea stewartii]
MILFNVGDFRLDQPPNEASGLAFHLVNVPRINRESRIFLLNPVEDLINLLAVWRDYFNI